MAGEIVLVPIDPFDKVGGLLFPQIAQRVLAMAREHVQEIDPEPFTRQLIARVTAGDPSVLLLAMVNGDGRVVGHATITLEQAGDRRWVHVSQCKADGNVGDAVKRAIELVDAWGRERGATLMTMATHRSDSAWQKKYGFQTHRYLMRRELGAPVGEGS